MAFSQFLQSRKSHCQELVKALQPHFAYVSVLGCDIKSTIVQVNRNTSHAGAGRDNECGFVLKLSNGNGFFEYALDDVIEDKEVLVKRILKGVELNPILAKQAIACVLPKDEPLVRDFERDSDINTYTNEQLVDFCATQKDASLALSSKIINAYCTLNTMDVHKLFVSANKCLTQHYSYVVGFVMAMVRENGKMVLPREFAGSHLLAEVMATLPTKVSSLIDKAEHLLLAKPIEPGVYDVICAPSIAGLIAHEAFGHGVEMDMFVKDRALAKYYVGKQVASALVNMHDGASSTLNVASYFFDDDGVLAHDTLIIKKGILVSGISDLVTASMLGTEPTGNGRRQNHTHKAYSRMTNTFFEPGNDKLEDMIASIKHGYLICETNNGMEDPKNWAIQCVAEYGIEIIDGKLTENWVSPVVISGYVPELLCSISMISDGLQVDGAGQCGKGYKEWVRVSDGGPYLKAKVKLG